MAWKGRVTDKFNIKGLEAILVNAKIATENNPLYQVNKGLINAAGQLKAGLDEKLNKTDKISLTDSVSGVLPYQNGGVLTGTYLPVLTNVANLDNSSPYYTPWFRVGGTSLVSLINVSGKVSLQPTAVGVLTELGMTLPFASLFEHEEQCSGVAAGVVSFGAGTDNFAATVTCDPLTGLALIRWFSTGNDTYDVRFNFNYQFIPK